MSIFPNTTLAHYTIISKIGAGGMGEVGTFDPTVQTIVAVSAETGEIKEASSKKFSRIEQIAWLSDGKNLLITALESPALPAKIWQVAYPSSEVKGFSNDLNEYSSISVTADAKALATMQTVQC